MKHGYSYWKLYRWTFKGYVEMKQLLREMQHYILSRSGSICQKLAEGFSRYRAPETSMCFSRYRARTTKINNTNQMQVKLKVKSRKQAPELPEFIIAQIAAYATDLQRPNSLTQDQITKCAAVGTESLKATDIELFHQENKKFVSKTPGDIAINNILNRSQNSNNGQVQRG